MSASPTTLSSPMTRVNTPPKPWRWSTSSQILWVAIAVSGALRDGFQMTVSPAIAATMAFQAHTAFGKLNAVITPHGPRGCHCSYMRCWDRSECMESPKSWRDIARCCS